MTSVTALARLRTAASVAAASVSATYVYKEHQAHQRISREDARIAQLRESGVTLSGVQIEERDIATPIIRHLAWLLPKHQSLIIPASPKAANGSTTMAAHNGVRHVGLGPNEVTPNSNNAPPEGWPKAGRNTHWRLHVGPSYENVKPGRVIPIEAWDKFVEKHGRSPDVDIQLLNSITRTPSEAHAAGENPCAHLKGRFLGLRRNAEGDYVVHNCRTALYDAVVAADRSLAHDKTVENCPPPTKSSANPH